jgi:carboxylesterase type B
MLVLLGVCATVAVQSEPPTVLVPSLGTVVGAPSALVPGVDAFRGIPYASQSRWQPPAATAPWAKPLDATAFGPACIQAGGKSSPGKNEEDCLFLNVFAPSGALGNDGPLLPVMLWIHGGAYNHGSSNVYSGDVLVAQSNRSVIVVTINYRLNIFGFLGSAEVSAATGGAGSGNFGIMDQRAAMTWTSQHIAAFGGNGSDITIFGESAGANSVWNHLTQPASFPLYTKAIMQSGTCRLMPVFLVSGGDGDRR